MQQLILNIDDQDMGEELSRIAKEQGKPVEDIILNEIRMIVREKPLSSVKKRDPLRHSVQIHYPAAEDAGDAKPFASVKDSAKFARELRKKLWKRR
jgi:hypothetical protein